MTPSNSTAPPPDAAAEPPSSAALGSDFVVLLAALLCTMITMVGLISVARCAWLRHRGAGSHPTVNRGLKTKVVQSLPKFRYDASSASGGAAECAICLAEYDEGDEIRVLPQCGHGFHQQCVDTWLGSHSTCPSCRRILVATGRCRKCDGGS